MYQESVESHSRQEGSSSLFVFLSSSLAHVSGFQLGFVSLLVKALASPTTATLYRSAVSPTMPEDEGELLSDL